MANNNSALALLIDADNISAKYIDGLMAEVANYGTASVRRIYGDWTSPSLKSWKECLLDHSISPMQQFAYTTDKNSTDSSLIIDAMDLLYTGRFSSFCIVSSDSDFTRLASRIREQGVTVYGFGERKTPSAFVAACDKFTFFDAFTVQEEHETRPTPPQYAANEPVPVPTQPKAMGRPLDDAAIRGLTMALTNAPSYGNDWVNLVEVGSYLRKYSPSLHARNYGYDRLKDFLEASRIAEVKLEELDGKPPIALARLKQKPSTPENNDDWQVR